MIKKLEDEQVFSVKLSENKTKVVFLEACDYYFGIDLNKKEFLELIDDFQVLADQMK